MAYVNHDIPPGPKKGSHWKHGSANWSGGPPRVASKGWPGPFVPRSGYGDKYLRPAVWLNCAYCGQLFPRNTSEVKSKSLSRGNASFCSVSCGRFNAAEPHFRVCSYCAKTFRLFTRNLHKRTCCDECARSVTSEAQTRIKHMPLIAYAFAHGVEADYSKLTCDLCGVAQRNHGKRSKSEMNKGKMRPGTMHWYVRITEVDGKYVARCKSCYEASRRAWLSLEPAQKTRLLEAQKLIEEVIR